MLNYLDLTTSSLTFRVQQWNVKRYSVHCFEIIFQNTPFCFIKRHSSAPHGCFSSHIGSKISRVKPDNHRGKLCSSINFLPTRARLNRFPAAISSIHSAITAIIPHSLHLKRDAWETCHVSKQQIVILNCLFDLCLLVQALRCNYRLKTLHHRS